ncbi:MAG TPA: hypothetical protein ENK75_02200, partial [Saprospiraceae bacterium]|nr:hypothetical protein [Saprospiraceae bacterium]
NKEYPFPFGTSRKDTSKEPGKIVSWIRDHGNYLISGEGINIWTAVAAFISAMFVNVLLFFTFFFSIFLLLNLPISTWAGKLISFVTIIMILFILYKKSLKLKSPKLKKYLFLILAFSALVLPYYLFIYDFTDPSDKNTFSSLLVLGLVSFICLGLFALHYSKEKVSPSLEHDVKVVYGHFFMYGTLFICIGLIPVIHCYLENISFMNIETSLLLTGASGLFMILSTIKGAAKNRLNEIVIFIGLNVLLIGVVVSIFRVTKYFSCYYTSNHDKFTNHSDLLYNITQPEFMFVIIASALLFGMYRYMKLADINNISIFKYYRDRLKEAFMPSVNNNGTLSMHETCTGWATYHLINTTINTSSSRKIKLRSRGGDNFILSPLFSGSSATGYLNSEQYLKNQHIDLATAMAISAAAFSPNTSVERSKTVAFLMTFFNIRLGYWVRNPFDIKKKDNVKKTTKKKRSETQSFDVYYVIFRELFGFGLKEDESHVLLTDGGHFDNLALYELVRRKCRYIIVSDAGADPDRTFGDLGKIVEMVRVDFGAQIDINTIPIHPKGKKKLADKAFVFGTIKY